MLYGNKNKRLGTKKRHSKIAIPLSSGIIYINWARLSRLLQTYTKSIRCDLKLNEHPLLRTKTSTNLKI